MPKENDDKQKQLEADRALIAREGGPTILARKLLLKVRRVENWNRRGIPPGVKLMYPEIFLDAKRKGGKRK